MRKSTSIFIGMSPPGSSMADDEFALPRAAYEDAIAIIGRRGRGKTTTAVVLAEEIHKLLHRFVALDPTGVWWGLKSSRDGKREGLPVIIMGGDHGDVPLELSTGKVIARFVADPKHPSVVLDLSRFDTDELATFMTAFYRELYLVNRHLLHVIFDEAQLIVPEQPDGKDGYLMKKAGSRLIQLGRAKGLLPILITPRPADVAKSALYACGMLVMHQLTAPDEQKSLHKWVKAHAATKAQAEEFMIGMGKLAQGVAWFWQPDLEIFAQVKVRERETYPSSSTAGSGVRQPPKKRAQVDMDALRASLADTVAKAEAEDPVVLGARLREATARIDSLQAQLGKPRAHEKVAVAYAPGKELVVLSTYLDDKGVYTVDVELPEAKTKEVKVEAISAHDKQLLMRLKKGIDSALQVDIPLLVKLMERIPEGAWPKSVPLLPEPPQMFDYMVPGKPEFKPGIPLKKGDLVQDVHGRHSVVTAAAGGAGADGVDKSEQKVLDAISWFCALGNGAPRIASVAFKAGYTVGAGRFNNLISSLKAKGFVVRQDNNVSLTSTGYKAAARHLLPGTAAELHGQIISVLPSSEGKLLRVIVDCYAQHKVGISLQGLAELTGYTLGTGRFNNLVGRLRSLELIENDPTAKGFVQPAPAMFPMNRQ